MTFWCGWNQQRSDGSTCPAHQKIDQSSSFDSTRSKPWSRKMTCAAATGGEVGCATGRVEGDSGNEWHAVGKSTMHLQDIRVRHCLRVVEVGDTTSALAGYLRWLAHWALLPRLGMDMAWALAKNDAWIFTRLKLNTVSRDIFYLSARDFSHCTQNGRSKRASFAGGPDGRSVVMNRDA